MSVRIIVDSTTDLRPQAARRVQVVPLTIHFGEREFVDGVDIDTDRFYRMLVQSDVLPTTSQPTPHAFGKVFAQAVEAGDSVVCITISAKLSGTFQSASIAAADYPGKVFVVDSRNVTIAAGVLVEYALELVDQGMSAEHIALTLMEKRDKVKLLAMVDTLEYLKKGGRITPAAAAVGTVLNLKPVLTIQGEQLDAFAKVRGMKAAKKRMITALEDDMNRRFSSIPRGELRLEAAYTCSDEEAFQWKQMLEEHFGQACDMSPLPLSIACHTGPGALGCAFTRQYIG